VTVAIKELKNRLSEYLRRVRAGETVYVTDRGRIIAELRPTKPVRSTDQEIVRRLAAEGLVSPGSGDLADFPPSRPVRPGKLASQVIIEDRD
jgi:prevent-host-death family protein